MKSQHLKRKKTRQLQLVLGKGGFEYFIKVWAGGKDQVSFS